MFRLSLALVTMLCGSTLLAAEAEAAPVKVGGSVNTKDGARGKSSGGPKGFELPDHLIGGNAITALLPVQVGTKVEFPNQDDAYHNVFSYSPAKRFDLGRYRPDEKPVPSQIFDKAGLVTLRCDIHEHMRALILVLDTPHFVLTGADGNFRLSGMPPGKYTLKAWVNSRTTHERAVEIKPGAKLQANFP